jgi:hypothetical protein
MKPQVLGNQLLVEDLAATVLVNFLMNRAGARQLAPRSS